LLTVLDPLGPERQVLRPFSISNERLYTPIKPLVQATPERAENLPLLHKGSSLLLELPLRLSDLPALHGREHLGHVLQQYQLAMPGLR